jgi:hypothetical protein
MDDTLITIVSVAGVLSLVAVIITVSIIAEKRRTEALTAVAQSMGLQFTADATANLHKSYRALPLFNRGRSRKAKNLMKGAYGGVELNVFDYQYTTGSGKNTTNWRQTVVLVESPSLALPELTVSPESFFHKIGSALGFQDIDFDDYPDFSKRYLLRGPNEDDIRAAFHPGVLTFFEQRQGVTAEGFGDLFAYYRAARRAKPPEVSGLITEALMLFKELAGTPGTKAV